MKRVRIGCTSIEIGHDYVTSTLMDGKVVEAMPHDTAEYAATAARVGYGGDLAAMNRDHELTHHLLADALGLVESPVMRAVAFGTWQHDPCGLLQLEEEAVLAVQRYARALKIDLIGLGVQAQQPRLELV